ncbi:growth hormone-regulated TBC protein 1 isoform X2 [Tursiops truncatus]|uniref:Growth hormone-regulated TBC protein 1 isoform X2 n=1 Tax=Tursiops truncatus TaxID=9739 RepID=A0A6J3QBS1_TURTR|nr:growth hormone-regulated TBC protein 1 isoform X2 [Tursiops truncatus]
MESAGRAQAARDRVPRIDPYGFERPEDFDYAAYEEFFSTYLTILTRRAIKWSRLLKGGAGVQKSVTLKRYIRKGVPLEHRARVWMGVSGAQAQMDQNPGYYLHLLQGEKDDSLEEAIRTDMNRTFPDNVRFRKGSDPCLQRTLYNVLLAYGHHNRGVGYCQGMNFLAGYLILVTRSEEESFWLLDALVGRILPDYYSPSMLGLKTDQEVLGELTVLRIWDCLFNEGSKIIFRVALTLIKEHQALILEATSVPDICEKFKDITRGSFVTECHTFMRVKTQPKCREICAVYGEGAVTAGTRQKWFEKCRAGDFSLDEAPQSSRPVEVDSDQIETLIVNSQCYTTWKIADILKISKSNVNHLNQLGYVNCFDVWVPHKLSEKKPS